MRGGTMRAAAAATVLLLLLVLVARPCSALYVRVRQGKGKCFIEMLEDNEVVVLRFRSPDQAPLPHEPEVTSRMPAVRAAVNPGHGG